MPKVIVEKGLVQLEADLKGGTWDAKYGALRRQQNYDAGYKFIVAEAKTQEPVKQ